MRQDNENHARFADANVYFVMPLLPLRDLKQRFLVRLALQAQDTDKGDTVKLSVPQIKALADAASVGHAELTQFRSATVNVLRTLGLIEKVDGYLYVITATGLSALREKNPTAPIADCHLTLDDVLSETVDTDSTPFLPEHLTHGLNGQKVRGSFFNSDREFNFRGIVKGEYLSAKIHGFRIPMVSVLTDDNRSILVPLGNVKLDNWHPTFIQGTDDSDPVLEVLGTELINGETVLWLNSPNGEFYVEANKSMTQRYWRAYPVQPEFTRWIVTRIGVTEGTSDFDRAMSSVESTVQSSRAMAFLALQRMLRAEIHDWADMGMDYKREELLFTDTLDHPERNRFERDGIRWTIRGW